MLVQLESARLWNFANVCHLCRIYSSLGRNIRSIFDRVLGILEKERKVVRRNSWIREIIHSISYLFSESSILKFVLKFFFFFRYPFVIFLFSSIENIPHPRFLSSILLSSSFFLPPLFFASFSPIVLHFFHPPRFSSYLHTISTLFPPLSRN